MKYNLREFDNAVMDYQRQLKHVVKRGNDVMVISDVRNLSAFYSIAPLSRAVHNLGADMYVAFPTGQSTNLKILEEVWEAYEDHLAGTKTEKTKALMNFINSVEKRTKKDFRHIFKRPELLLRADDRQFNGKVNLPFKHKWFKKYRWGGLLHTARTIWKQGYNLKKGENVGIAMVLMPPKKDLELPLEDYLDSYAIAFSMADVAGKMGAKVSIGGVTDKFSSLAQCERVSDLMSTLLGCELDKNVNEDVFRAFKPLSKAMKLDRIRFNAASFGIHGKGYIGKLFFGTYIGYPSLNRKTRWSSPGSMLVKDRFSPQTKYETRDPKMRHAITETLPLDIFIETCNINYKILKGKSDRVRDIFNKCSYIRVIGNKQGNYQTDLTVNLLTPAGIRREFTSSDCDVTSIVDMEHYNKTGEKTGSFANFPSGEAFVTPESVSGTLIGDVVINVDQSHILKSPLVISISPKGYKIVKGPRKVVAKMRKELADARKRIADFEKNKSLPKEIIQIYKRNFNSIGEFAVNTNPKAKLCDYLIVNEKIARMIHLALGSGFEPDKKSVYHWDIVVNSPRQKFDIYGVDKKGQEHWVMKKGNLLV